MIKLFGNRESAWAWTQGSTPTGPLPGTAPYSPIATFGGMIQVVVDVQVPAVAHGVDADFSSIYPDLPGTEYVILEYTNPLDTTQKLHGKGNLLIYDALVLNGTGACGAVGPNTGPPNGLCDIQVDLLVSDGGSNFLFWRFTGDNPVDSGDVVRLWTPSSQSKIVMGGDFSGRTRLLMRFANQDGAANLVAGRLRVVLFVAEV